MTFRATVMPAPSLAAFAHYFAPARAFIAAFAASQAA